MDRKAIAYLVDLDDERLEREVVYSNQTGKSFRDPPRDILTHLAMHSHYHRGQIALLVRQAGEAPAVTDFVAFCRLGR